MNISKWLLPALFLLMFSSVQAQRQPRSEGRGAPVGQVWTVEKASQWYALQPWITGANFIPSTAINQLEMWQAETYDSATIRRELGWAASIGFNTMRVFLHSLVYRHDPEGMKARIDNYL